MADYRFHKKGLYAHPIPRQGHVEVRKDGDVHDVDKDMALACDKYGWAVPADVEPEDREVPVNEPEPSHSQRTGLLSWMNRSPNAPTEEPEPRAGPITSSAPEPEQAGEPAEQTEAPAEQVETPAEQAEEPAAGPSALD